MKPNIVLINVDQWRGDCLSASGHPDVLTPYLDEASTEGVIFRRAYTSVSTCIASRAALHTGLSQRSHGRVGYLDMVPWDYPTTLAGTFRDAGWQTEAVGKMHVYPERERIGFEHVTLHDGYLHSARARLRNLDDADDYLPWLRQQMGRDADYYEHGLDCNSWVARPWDKPEFVHPTNFIVHKGLEFLRRRDPRRPFFLYLSFHRPHPPYDPPDWAFQMYMDRQLSPSPQGNWSELYKPLENRLRPDAWAGKIDPYLLRRAKAGYYGHMSHIDAQIKRFTEGVHDQGLRENTWYCFVSDHGEMMGDHGLFRKGFPYEGSSRVPLILWGPESAGLKRGASVDGLAELRDIAPTLLDCAGIKVPAVMEGHSLLPMARGQSEKVREHLHGEHELFGQDLHWMSDGRMKYVWLSGSGAEQLFDLVKDPQELNDLAKDPATKLDAWRSLMAKELEGREEGYSKDGKLVAGKKPLAILSMLSPAVRDN